VKCTGEANYFRYYKRLGPFAKLATSYLFADIERELISLRTQEGLAAARAAGKRLGRPKGKLGWSKLTGKEEEIQKLLQLQVSKASIAKITGVDRSTLSHFLRSRHLLPQDDTP
jgi:DNA invertase Pin-like site-specific DNA recombinase